MVSNHTRSSRLAPSAKWSLYAGLFAFLCSTIVLRLLYPVSNTLVKILTVPADYSAFVLAAPVTIVAAVVWWTFVERREEYTYRFGAAFGFLTAAFTVLFWVLVSTLVYGLLSFLTGSVLVVFVFAVSLPAALITGLTLMYARRSLNDGSAATNGQQSKL